MIEYIDDVIRVSANEEALITAEILDENGLAITEGCNLVVHLPNEEMLVVYGKYDDDKWSFPVPALESGKYEYCIRQGSESLCFRKAFYVK